MSKNKKIKVLVLKSYKGLKTPGSIVMVNPGYANNYLVKNGIVAIATEEKIKEIESIKSSLLQNDQKVKQNALVAKESLDSKVFIVVRVAGEDDRLYGSISANDIANMVNDHLAVNGIEYKLRKTQVQSNYSIKQIGIFDVAVSLHSEVEAHIRLNVCRSANDSDENLRKHEAEKAQTK